MSSAAVHLGIDTSNYTSSVALYQKESGRLLQQRRPLPVREGMLGLRQSDALFQHTLQLPELMRELFSKETERPAAMGVSARPRDAEGSYMPCFLAGVSAAQCAAAALGVPLYEFSHQAGHLAAALYSANRLDLREEPFLAFHVSGGTTELLLVKPDAARIFHVSRIGGSLDLHAGQVIDRVGKQLGLPFPAGAELDRLAANSTASFRPKPFVRGLDCSFSGLENQCGQMREQGAAPEDVGRYCLAYICEALSLLTRRALEQYGELPVVFSGGVMANSLLRAALGAAYHAVFAQPEFSTDNAAGIAVLTWLCHNGVV